MQTKSPWDPRMSTILLLCIALLCQTIATAQTPTPQKVDINWQHATNDTTGITFDVWRAPDSCAGAFVRVASAITLKTYTDQPPKEGVYCYYVTTTRAGGATSIRSKFAMATVELESPTKVTAAPQAQ